MFDTVTPLKGQAGSGASELFLAKLKTHNVRSLIFNMTYCHGNWTLIKAICHWTFKKKQSVTLTTVGMFNVGVLQSCAKEYLTKPYKEISWS